MVSCDREGDPIDGIGVTSGERRQLLGGLEAPEIVIRAVSGLL
jgi:hypothetical protein